MAKFTARASIVFVGLLLLPAAVFAQAAITGVVKDASGGVLPGATVEAASPALIEKVRSVISDATGQYRIVNLRPGTYSVTFTLPGFSTVKRDGIELTGTFVATVNGELKVGALEETITVTGETPVVDVQSAKVQQTVSKDVLAAIPTSHNATGITSLIPGMSNTSDSGGITGGIGGGVGTIHGGRANDARTYGDGLNTGWGGGSAGGGNMQGNTASAQEVVVSTSGGLGEAETSGVILNVIPRDGGNSYTGSFLFAGAKGGMQGNNYTQSLQDQGLKAPSQLISLYDVTPMGGGRIIRDKLWFYVTYRQVGAHNTVPGMFVNVNAGNPAKQFTYPVQFDTTKQAFTDDLQRNGIGRITIQASPRNKINLQWSEQYSNTNYNGGGTATQTIEATNRNLFQPSHMQQATWSSPVTSRLLLEAGFGTYLATYRFRERNDGTFNPLMIRVTDQGGSIPGLSYNQPSQFTRSSIGTREWRASLSYVSGAQNMKFGYQGGFDDPDQGYYYMNSLIAYRFNNGAPNQLTETGVYPGTVKYVRNLLPANFYGQDQWTHNRLTLQGGVRYDHILTSYPLSQVIPTAIIPNGITYPSRSTPGIHWNDITPRMGVAYDLFGNGKTALKFNLGKYMEAFSATNTDLDLNPLIRNTVSTTRSWTDNGAGGGIAKDFVPQCNLANPLANGECGPVADNKIGTANFTRSYDPAFTSGWGVRPYNWSLGASVQQQVLPRVSVTVGYARNWWGNWYVVANQIGVATATGASTLANYTPYSIVVPSDPRLPGGGGQTIGGLYNLIPNLVGQVNEVAQSSNNFGKQIENWQGVDINVNARLRNGLTVQGGTSTGRRLADDCAVRAVLPELGAGVGGVANNSIAGGTSNASTTTGFYSSVTNPYCRVVEPYLTQIRGLATYMIPKAQVQVSGTWSSIPGPVEGAVYNVPNSAVIQSLGRSLSGGAANASVNLIAPGTLYGPRQNRLDIRIAKVIRYGRTRSQLGVDIYNVFNSDTPLTYNNTFVPGGSWLTPLTISPARYAKISLQVDF